MSPENQWLEDVFPIEIIPFWGGYVFGGFTLSWQEAFGTPFLRAVGEANLVTGLL